MSENDNFLSEEMQLIGIFLEGFFYGLYSAVFSIYIQYQASKGDKRRNILLYPLCALYVLSTATFVLDIKRGLVPCAVQHPSDSLLVQVVRFIYTSTTINGLCDFIYQAILIYRCWIAWSCNIRVIIIPSVLTLAFLATWLAINVSVHKGQHILSHQLLGTHLGYVVTLASLAISLIVNAVVTGLIVFRILKVYWEVSPTVKGQTLEVGETRIRSIIFIIIESAVAMFTIQFIRFVLSILLLDALHLIVGTYQMLNGLTPTIILVRVSMGLSYYDEKSMVETAASWRFVSHNPVSEIGEIAGQERETHIKVQLIDDVEIVER